MSINYLWNGAQCVFQLCKTWINKKEEGSKQLPQCDNEWQKKGETTLANWWGVAAKYDKAGQGEGQGH